MAPGSRYGLGLPNSGIPGGNTSALQLVLSSRHRVNHL